MKAKRLAALVGLAGFVITTVALHFVQPGLNPRDAAVSYYVHGSLGWLLTIGLVGLGLGSLALTSALFPATQGPGARPGRWLVGTWSVGVLLGGMFPADPAGHWDAPPSLAGMVHGNAAMVAFLVLPLGALFLAKSFRRDPQWKRRAALLSALAVATAVSLGLFFASLVPVFIRPGPPILLGMTERILLAVYVAWLAAVAVNLPHFSARPSAS
jgi:Protein of unknown function (DUF998)